MEPCISALAMRFKTVLRVIAALAFGVTAVSAAHAGSEVIDRIVASVNNTAITLSELRERHAAMKNTLPSMTEHEVLQSMINAQLLLEKARHMRVEGSSPDELIATYIDLKIRAFIVVREDAIRGYYQDNRDKLGGNDYRLVRDEIEKYLTEQEANRLLQQHIESLRAGADITVLP